MEEIVRKNIVLGRLVYFEVLNHLKSCKSRIPEMKLRFNVDFKALCTEKRERRPTACV